VKVFYVFRRDLEEIVLNKKYMIGFFFQLILLLTIVPSFGSVLEEGSLALPAPTLKEFLPIGMVDPGGGAVVLTEELENDDRFEILDYSEVPYSDLRDGRITAVLVVGPFYDEGSLDPLDITIITSRSNFKRGAVLEALDTAISASSARIGSDRAQSVGADLSEPFAIDREFLRPVVIEAGGSRFSSFFLGYLIPMILFFPIFMSGGLVVDSIVGEKEAKTLESLLTAPIPPSTIIVGKFMAVWAFLSTQVLLWIWGLGFVGVPISNVIQTFLLLSSINAAVIAAAFLFALYSPGMKSANISLMLMYVVVFTGLVTSLSIEFFNPRPFFEMVPFNAISRLATGEGVSFGVYVFQFLGLIWLSSVMIWASSILIKRDDITFGPRPGLFTLFSDVTDIALKRLEQRRFLACVTVSGLSTIVALPLALIFEVFLGLLIFFFLGISQGSITLMVLAFALVEEMAKPLGLYALKERHPKWITTPGSGFILGASAGFGFFLFENLFFVIITLMIVPSLVFKILTLRAGTTMLIHIISSGIAGLGVSRNQTTAFILLAWALHGAFNLVVVM
jgi:ABC-2 type transport system permease protein